ncbi:MAG: hypothetical protein JRG89_14040, partial [Deltaproteobacteria bacterium]|nr:hypothetical protein [Deltaproteobacteria bacterium]
NGRLHRQARDLEGRGHAHVLYEFDKKGKAISQEIASGKSKKPDKKVFYDGSGQVTRQCTDSDGDGDFEIQLTFENGVASHALLDSNNDGRADRREIYRDGALVRVEADTNGDRRPDVVQEYEGQTIVQQEEDTDFDGKIDVRFRAGKPVELKGTVKAPRAVPEIECGQFGSFWN